MPKTSGSDHCPPFVRPALLLLAVLAGSFALTATARAEVISLSGTAFIRQCPCPSSDNQPDVSNGVLFPTNGANFYAAVDFPANGLRICSLSLVYHDINANDALTARLFRKSSVVGSDPLAAPKIIAEVSSAAGVVNTVRRATTRAITLPLINDNAGFYFVQVAAPTINLNLVGVQIDYRQTCP